MHTRRARSRCYAASTSAITPLYICVLAAVLSRRGASIIYPSRDFSILQYVSHRPAPCDRIADFDHYGTIDSTYFGKTQKMKSFYSLKKKSLKNIHSMRRKKY
jgi:hypothetical protein